MGRGTVALAILAAWGAGIAAYAQREASRSPRERLAEVAARVAPGATYLAVERDGRHVGFASSTIDTVPGGLQVTDYLVADLPVGEALGRTTAQSVVRLSRGLGLRDFALTFVTGRERVRATGRTVGDSLLEYVVSRAERPGDTTRVRLTGPLFLPTLVPLPVMLGETPEVGQTVTVQRFDPMSMRVGPLALQIRAESLFVLVDSAAFDPASQRWAGAHADTVRGFRLMAGAGDDFDAWVDEFGAMIMVRAPAGLTMRRTAYEVAFENWRRASPLRAAPAVPEAERSAGSDPRRLTSRSAIAAGVIENHAALDTLRLLVRGGDLAKLALAGGDQSRHGDTVTVARFPGHRLRPTTSVLPLDGAARARYAPELRSEPMLEVDHPAIAALARRLRRRRVLVDEVAGTMMQWVHDSLTRESALGLPSALATYRSRTGDVSEHAQLFVALARAAGIPARTVSGVLLIDGHFYYHAWAEVMLQQWVGVDPTLGQFPVDASHVRFLVGGIAAQAELTRLLGRLDLRVLSQTSPTRRNTSRP